MFLQILYLEIVSFFTQFTRDIILNDINANASCLNDINNGNPTSLILKSWSNFRTPRRIGTWNMDVFDKKIVGNFDGENDDEEILFINTSDSKWSTLLDFSCDQGTDWYHLWSNFASNTIGTWNMNPDDAHLSGDFDGDGKTELFSISNDALTISIHSLKTDYSDWILRYSNYGTQNAAGWVFNTNDYFVVADFDGDNKDELLCINPSGYANLIKFTASGNNFNASYMWSNFGSGWIGGVNIGNTNRWLSGKFTNNLKSELLSISDSWVTTQKFDGTNWQWIWSQYGANNFAIMYILPLNNTHPLFSNPVTYIHTFTGNFDNDNNDEFVVVGNQWVASADFDGTSYNQNWNNSGNYKLNDWDLNMISDYIYIKASPTEKKQILGTNYLKKKAGWWIFSSEWIEPNLCGMYRGNDAFQNFRLIKSSVLDSKDLLSIFPNPSSNNINFTLPTGIDDAKVTIFSELGKVVSTSQITRLSNSISISHLIVGIYNIRVVFSDGKVFTSKIIKNEN